MGEASKETEAAWRYIRDQLGRCQKVRTDRPDWRHLPEPEAHEYALGINHQAYVFLEVGRAILGEYAVSLVADGVQLHGVGVSDDAPVTSTVLPATQELWWDLLERPVQVEPGFTLRTLLRLLECGASAIGDILWHWIGVYRLGDFSDWTAALAAPDDSLLQAGLSPRDLTSLCAWMEECDPPLDFLEVQCFAHAGPAAGLDLLYFETTGQSILLPPDTEVSGWWRVPYGGLSVLTQGILDCDIRYKGELTLRPREQQGAGWVTIERAITMRELIQTVLREIEPAFASAFGRPSTTR